MTRQPIGPKPLPDDLIRAMKTFAITNSLQGAEGPRPMTPASRQFALIWLAYMVLAALVLMVIS